MLDFGAWVNEEYTVPTEEAPLSEESSRSPDAGPNHPDAAS